MIVCSMIVYDSMYHQIVYQDGRIVPASHIASLSTLIAWSKDGYIYNQTNLVVACCWNGMFKYYISRLGGGGRVMRK